MSFAKQCLCDVCGKQKGEVNHWYMATNPMPDVLSFRPWLEEIKERLDIRHLCGQECAHKMLDKFMQEQMSAVQDSKETIEAKA